MGISEKQAEAVTSRPYAVHAPRGGRSTAMKPAVEIASPHAKQD